MTMTLVFITIDNKEEIEFAFGESLLCIYFTRKGMLELFEDILESEGIEGWWWDESDEEE